MPRRLKTKIKKTTKKRASKERDSSIKKTEDEEEKRKLSIKSEFCHQRKSFTGYVMTSSGIKASIVRAIVCLYEEPCKPDEAIGYITSLLGGTLPSEDDLYKMKAKIQELRDKIVKLEEDNLQLQSRVEEVEVKGKKYLMTAGETVGEYEGETEYENYYPMSLKPNLDGNISLASCVDSLMNFAL